MRTESYSFFLQDLKSGALKEVLWISRNTYSGTLEAQTRGRQIYQVSVSINLYEQVVQACLENRVRFSSQKQSPYWPRYFRLFVRPLLVFGLPIGLALKPFIFRDGLSLSQYFFKSSDNSDENSPDLPEFLVHEVDTSVNFEDLILPKRTKMELMELTEMLKNPNALQQLGARLPSGVLLHGPPGTGKTMAAKALANVGGFNFLSVSAAEIEGKYVGSGAKRIRELFRAARNLAPCIIYIDEFDAIAKCRQDHTERFSAQTLNQLLSEMDGFQTQGEILVIAATNFQQQLDPAVLRSGRFDRKVHFLYPTVLEREQILRVHILKHQIPIEPSFSLKALACKTADFSGADLEHLTNEAAIRAARKQKPVVDSTDFQEALWRIQLGSTIPSIKAEEAIRATARHEAGHLLVLWKLDSAQLSQDICISVERHNNALGIVAMKFDDQLLPFQTERSIKSFMAMCYGGRESEVLFYGEEGVSGGCIGDLEIAKQKALAYIACGYDKRLPALPELQEQLMHFKSLSNFDISGYSGVLQERINAAILQQLKQAREQAHQILKQNKPLIDKLSDAVIRKGTLYYDDISKFFQDNPVQ